jgi:drug/metabolite transporter (DMT)-like permease
MLFLGERPSPFALLGAVVVIAAVYVAIRAEFPRSARRASVQARSAPVDQSA